MTHQSRKASRACLMIVISLLVVAVIGLSIALTVVLVLGKKVSPMNRHVSRDFDAEHETRKHLFKNVDTKRVREHLRVISKEVHPAGTAPNIEVGKYLEAQYKATGVDKVVTHEYSVFLAYPDYDTPNTVYYTDGGGQRHQLSNGTGDKLGPPDAQAQLNSWAPHWWNGYAKGGKATGTIVYGNYGTIDDLDTVEKMGIKLNGSIVIVRYGHLWRGAKVREATRRGAVGVILFSDPMDYGPPNDTNPFPDSVYLPPGAAQRGSVMNFNGDPMTPFYPAFEYAPRLINESQLRDQLILPSIPVFPIGYRDALQIFETLDGPAAPADFIGGMSVPYKLSGSRQYEMNVYEQNEPRMAIKDVCAYIYGKDEPDEIVLIGNHYDAWSNGAMDPNSGTSITLELARTFMQTVNETDWRPRRTIAICNWDAEEYGLIGSVEFVEEMLHVLNGRAVTVINVDMPIGGNMTLMADGTPNNMRALINATKLVKNPNKAELDKNRNTVYDSWLHYASMFKEDNMPMQPPIWGYPGSGSDHYSFMAYAGVSVIDFEYDCLPRCTNNFYHTMFEIPWTVENLVDRDLETTRAVAQTALEIARLMADTLVIPHNVADYAHVIKVTEAELDLELNNEGFNKTVPWLECTLSLIKDSIKRLEKAAMTFQKEVDHANSGAEVTERQVQMLNRRLLEFERAFIAPRGLYKGSFDRHVIFSASVHDSYLGVTYSGVRDPAEYYRQAVAAGNDKEAAFWIDEIQYSLANLQYAVESAILLLDLGDYHTEY